MKKTGDYSWPAPTPGPLLLLAHENGKQHYSNRDGYFAGERCDPRDLLVQIDFEWSDLNPKLHNAHDDNDADNKFHRLAMTCTRHVRR